ncbi:MAG: ribosome maturation factor RimP [Oscillospiraceae bacterium]
MSKITDIVTELAAPVVERNGCELWDVEYVREAGTWFLRVYIDKEGGVSINDCEAVSRELDPILDEADPIAESYTFEVSSAGAERQLRRPSDFGRFMGSFCCVKLYSAKDGSKEHLGYLCGYEDGAVTISAGDKEKRFEKSEIASVHLRIE